ncbi:UNKNOWN [Stylonychia lemnae]|uniref:Uncharacterized protein n=1 Tax=Stylonychia lemnae TaxID=5949 RepID=A0A078AKT4_STYLE|nr:UNKNOWN [Stylonychia lemnae]|eukprot:CDW81408.1 UNKNOWN [Stylonychia lemnae]
MYKIQGLLKIKDKEYAKKKKKYKKKLIKSVEIIQMLKRQLELAKSNLQPQTNKDYINLGENDPIIYNTQTDNSKNSFSQKVIELKRKEKRRKTTEQRQQYMQNSSEPNSRRKLNFKLSQEKSAASELLQKSIEIMDSYNTNQRSIQINVNNSLNRDLTINDQSKINSSPSFQLSPTKQSQQNGNSHINLKEIQMLKNEVNSFTNQIQNFRLSQSKEQNQKSRVLEDIQNKLSNIRETYQDQMQLRKQDEQNKKEKILIDNYLKHEDEKMEEKLKQLRRHKYMITQSLDAGRIKDERNQEIMRMVQERSFQNQINPDKNTLIIQSQEQNRSVQNFIVNPATRTGHNQSNTSIHIQENSSQLRASYEQNKYYQKALSINQSLNNSNANEKRYVGINQLLLNFKSQ